MQTIAGLTIIGCLIAELVAAPLYFGKLSQLLTYLQQNRNDQWVKLGSPTLFLNNSISNSSKVMQYLMKKEYLGAGDATLGMLAAAARARLIVSFSLGVLMLLAAFAMMLSR